MPREVELKSVVDDVAERRRRVEAAGGRLVFAGRLHDRRYDTPERTLVARDHVLRLRVHRDASGARAALEWKGATRLDSGYKVRDELSASSDDGAALAAILERLGYVVIREIDREVAQYALEGAVVRFEEYPRMDPLVEVEGSPKAIERAIGALGLPREGFTTERLPEFVARYEARTGERAAIAERELGGDYVYDPRDA